VSLKIISEFKKMSDMGAEYCWSVTLRVVQTLTPFPDH